ncbi:MAG: fibronectin type III domain-containing protein [Burkholderiales bacterium]|nr:fibronectin type III domain-containing protein [Burkholderiales bacterium]
MYGFATAAGQVNISPLTDLVVAKALGSDPAAAFASFDAAKGTTVTGNLTAAKAYVQTQVTAITGSGTADPLTSAFAVGSTDDKVLDALGSAIAAAPGKAFADLRTGAQSGASLASTVPAFLAAPTGAAAVANGADNITLNWSAVPGARGYNVYSSTSANVSLVAGNKLTTTPVATAGGFSVTGLSPSTTYYFKVTATNAVVTESAPTAEVNAITSAAAVPAAPTGVSVSPTSATQLTVSWSGVSGATGYNVYRSTVAGGAGSKVNATPISTGMTFTDTGLTANTTYFYKVTVINTFGEGAASAEISATTTSAASGSVCVATAPAALNLPKSDVCYTNLPAGFACNHSTVATSLTGLEIATNSPYTVASAASCPASTALTFDATARGIGNPTGVSGFVTATSRQPTLADMGTLPGKSFTLSTSLINKTSLGGSCTVAVAADGTINITATGASYSANPTVPVKMNGYALTESIVANGSNGANISAYSSTYAAVVLNIRAGRLDRVDVIDANAGSLSCVTPNNNLTTLGQADSNTAMAYATASDLSATRAGVYKNADNCQLTISQDGTFRFQLPVSTALTASTTGTSKSTSNSAAIDVTAILGGDARDQVGFTWVTMPSGISGTGSARASETNLLTSEYSEIGFTESVNLGGLGSPLVRSVTYNKMPTNMSSTTATATCNSMVKQ